MNSIVYLLYMNAFDEEWIYNEVGLAWLNYDVVRFNEAKDVEVKRLVEALYE